MKKVVIIFVFILAVSALYAKSSRFKYLELFNQVLYLIETQYYRPVDTEKLVVGAIRGMMRTLDPHSTFLREKVLSKLEEETKGEFGGLGIEVTIKEGIIVITTPIDDTPAFRAGLQPGDRILEINHESIVGLTMEEAVGKLRGKVNTSITLGIQRKGIPKIKHYTITRQIIKVRPVKSRLLEDSFIYIRLSQFQQKSYSSVVDALKKHRRSLQKSKKDLKGIVLDLRFNPGGLLEQAINISSIFLDSGIIVSTEGRNPKDKEIHYAKKTGYKELEIPLVVLINGASASASEIVAGALQDSKRAVIMGSVSFGKGSVQSVVKIDKNNGVKLTIRQYMTPAGRKIQAMGIRPDVELPQFPGATKDEEWQDYFVRERDLRGHLTATIETEKEKQDRLKRETQKRKKRAMAIRRYQAQKKNQNKDQKNDRPLYRLSSDPQKDHQVVQAINYLKGHNALLKKGDKR